MNHWAVYKGQHRTQETRETWLANEWAWASSLGLAKLASSLAVEQITSKSCHGADMRARVLLSGKSLLETVGRVPMLNSLFPLDVLSVCPSRPLCKEINVSQSLDPTSCQ